MNWDQVSGNWAQFKGKVRQRWGDLTDDEVQKSEGQKDVLIGRIQERYGLSREVAERQLSDWLEKLH